MLDIKPRDVQVAFIAATDTTVLRSRTWDRLKFEVEYSLQRGTTANSYVISALNIYGMTKEPRQLPNSMILPSCSAPNLNKNG